MLDDPVTALRKSTMIEIPDEGSVVILHDTDQDGYGAAAAAAYWADAHDTKYTLVPLSKGAYHNGLPFEDLPEDDGGLYLVLDFSFENDELFTLSARGPVAVIDHHRTFAERVWPEHAPQMGVKCVQSEDTPGSYVAVYDENCSAAVLTWLALVAEPPAVDEDEVEIPDVLAYIQDYDLWNWDFSKTSVVHEGLEVEGYEVEDLLGYIGSKAGAPGKSMNGLMKAGRVAVNYRDKQLRALAKHAKIRTVLVPHKQEGVAQQENAVFVKCASSNLKSNLADVVLEDDEEAAFACIYTADLVENNVYCSLRSRGGFDVGRVAESFGGGGHEAAAGFKCSVEDFQQWIQSEPKGENTA